MKSYYFFILNVGAINQVQQINLHMFSKYVHNILLDLICKLRDQNATHCITLVVYFWLSCLLSLKLGLTLPYQGRTKHPLQREDLKGEVLGDRRDK